MPPPRARARAPPGVVVAALVALAALLARAAPRAVALRPFIPAQPASVAAVAGGSGVVEAAVEHGSAEHALTAAALARGSAFWGADVVLVLTWHTAQLDWVAKMPLRFIKLAIYVKGTKRRCADVPDALRAALALCRETHNAAGREAHTMAQFALDFYASPPRIAVFAQDDGVSKMHHNQLNSLIAFGGSAESLAAWVARAERRPFGDAEECLCRVIVEDWWTPCPDEAPFPEGTPRCYGDTYWPMRWFMETFLELPEAGRWSAVRWAEAAQLAVPGWALRSRPRVVYAVALQLLNGTRLPEPDGHTAEEGGTNAEQYRSALLHRSERLHDRAWSVHEWAHVFERLWLAVFDTRYTPQGPQPAEEAEAQAEADAAQAAAAGAAATPPQPPAKAAPTALEAAASARAAADAAEGLLLDLRLPGQAGERSSGGADDDGFSVDDVAEALPLATGGHDAPLPDARAFLAAAQGALK